LCPYFLPAKMAAAEREHPLPRRTRYRGGDALDREWRCVKCGKLLGRWEGDRLRVRLGRRHEYLVSLPVAATCWVCGGQNEYPRGQPTKNLKTTVPVQK
jgi:RNase P subunit RPR2